MYFITVVLHENFTSLCILLQLYVFYYKFMYFITSLCILLQLYVFYYNFMYFNTTLCILLQVYVFYYRNNRKVNGTVTSLMKGSKMNSALTEMLGKNFNL